MIINREWGLAMNENPLQGSYVIDELTDLVEAAVLAEFDRISERGGVLGAMETGYQRGRIQDESMLYEHRKHDGSLPIIGVNTFRRPDADDGTPDHVELARATEEEKASQLRRVRDFQAVARRRGRGRPGPAQGRPRRPATTCSRSSWTPPGSARSARSPRRSSRWAGSTGATSEPRVPREHVTRCPSHCRRPTTECLNWVTCRRPPHVDDLGTPYDGPRPAARVVSLVPSITEALASVRRGAVVGATDWCTHPADLDDSLEARVRGTKNPDLAAIARPAARRGGGQQGGEPRARRPPAPRGRDPGLGHRHRDGPAGGGQPRAAARRARLGPPGVAGAGARRVVRRPPAGHPEGRDRRSGATRGWSSAGTRSPATWSAGSAGRTSTPTRRTATRRSTLDELDDAGADVVLLPDEPYVFTADDGPEAFTGPRPQLVSGRLLTWYGPSLARRLATCNSPSTVTDIRARSTGCRRMP